MRFAGLAAFLVVLAAHARAQEVWTLTTGDFRNSPVNLKSIDAAGLRVVDTTSQAERLVPMDDFLQLERPLPTLPGAPARFVLHLVGGDQLAGEPVTIAG